MLKNYTRCFKDSISINTATLQEKDYSYFIKKFYYLINKKTKTQRIKLLPKIMKLVNGRSKI